MEAAPPSTFHFRSNPLSVRPVHWAQQWLSTRLVFGCWDPQAQPLLMPSCTYQSCIFIVSDRDPLSGSGGGSEHLWLETRNRRFCPRFLCISDMPPCSFTRPRRRVIDTFWSAGDKTRCRGRSRGNSQRRESACFSTLMWCFSSENVLDCYFVGLFWVSTRP